MPVNRLFDFVHWYIVIIVIVLSAFSLNSQIMIVLYLAWPFFRSPKIPLGL